jgi:pyruvate ferredoxin oxidoreductase gamma subunit/2-oxoisovalerate ferredoxin oxidoreductase gamma subunit
MRLHGLGGQGAVTLITWIAQAGYDLGKHVQAFPFFGAERRGAPVKAFVRVDDKPIDLRSQVYVPDLLVVMSPDLTGTAIAEGIKPDGCLLMNGGKVLAESIAERFAREVCYIDATGIAIGRGLEVDGMPMVNIPLFGAIVHQSEIAGIEQVLSIVRSVASRRGNAESYVDAVTRGFDGVEVASPQQEPVR